MSSTFLLAGEPALHYLGILARAGGGGSSSGGGAGSILILIGYVPMHLLGALLRRLKAKHKVEFDIFQFGGWIVAVVYAGIFAVLGSVINDSNAFFFYTISVSALIGMAAGLYGWFGKLKQTKQTKQALAAAAQTDAAWDPDKLLARAHDVFMRYQQDWTNYNADAMKAYLTPTYQYHAALMVYALQLAARRDYVQNPTISQAMVINVDDEVDNSKDQVVIGITARANDQLIDTRSSTTIFTDNNDFTEFWRFRRSGDDWLLDGIQQATAAQWVYSPALEQFAASQGYYFSLDWGWLLLPSRGRLFSQGAFGVSDINNHVIGMHNNNLVQLYTFNVDPNHNNKTYLIAQTYVPKSYGQIVVERRHGLDIFDRPYGLKEVTTEWPDFNKKYHVYASDAEQVTSFELLNPKYMEVLEALPFEVNIEVVDNVVYLYAPQYDKAAVPDRYAQMLSVLNQAFVEMRL